VNEQARLPLTQARFAAGLPVLLIYNVDPAWASHERDEVERETHRLGSAMEELGHPLTLIPIADANIAAELEAFHPEDHIVLNWCESLPGISHSEAMVAEMLESLKFIFTGADSRTLALSQNKQRVKTLLADHSNPTPRWEVYETVKVDGWECFPAIVKPVHEHCSIGITPASVVMTMNELQQRVRYVLDTYGQPALVEDFIDGREFRVSLWGNSPLEPLPVVEMAYSAFPDIRERLCTYDSKFAPSSRHYQLIETLLPAPLPEDAHQRLCDTAAAAYSVVGCRDYGRIDLRLRDGVFYVLDVNPNPDISADASMACAAELAGFSYGAFGSFLVALAAIRHPQLRHYGVNQLEALRNHRSGGSPSADLCSLRNHA
jgi:D-alanine-D-alanine ligase